MGKLSELAHDAEVAGELRCAEPHGSRSSTEAHQFHVALCAAGFEYSALSWNGFNLFGSFKSIEEAKRLTNADARVEALQRTLKEALDRAARVTAIFAWQPIATIPRDGKNYLFTRDEWSWEGSVVVGFWHDGHNDFRSINDGGVIVPGIWKYWMPLPSLSFSAALTSPDRGMTDDGGANG